MNERVLSYLCQERGVTRFCHLTNISSMFSMALDEFNNGILATAYIPLDNRYQNDNVRMDNCTDYINCSCQYPNYKYLFCSKDRVRPFNTWCCLFIDPRIITVRRARFSVGNAARHGGADIRPNLSGIESMFAGRNRGRRLASCPDDIQAEILIERDIPWTYVTGIAVETSDIARRIYRTLIIQYGKTCPELYVAPDIFSNQCEMFIRNGKVPMEEDWQNV